MIADENTNGNAYADMFDLRAGVRTVIAAIQQHRMIVLITCAITLGLAVWYAYAWPPIYRVDAAIMAEKDTDTSRDGFYGNWNIFRKDDARTEIELMTSGPILKEVIEKEKLTYDDIYHPFLSQIGYFWEKSFIGRNYRAMKLKLFPEKDSEALTPEQLELGKTISDMGAGIIIQSVGESNMGKVTVKGPSRRVAQIANTLLDVYLARRTERYQTEATKAFDILNSEVARSEKQLRDLDQRRMAYSDKYGLVFDLQKETIQLKQLTELEASIAASKARIGEMEASLAEVEKQLVKEPPTKTISSFHELSILRETTKMRRLELETALIQVRNRYREDSREVQEIKADIAKLNVLLAEQPEKVEKGTTEGLNAVQQQLVTSRGSLLVQLEGARAGLALMEGTAAQMQARLSTVPTMQATLNDLDREYTLAQQVYQALMLKRVQAAVSVTTAKAAMPSMRVVAYAMPPGGKWWPRAKFLYPGALLLGLFLGVLAAVITSYASGTIRREHLEHGRRAVPLYGTISVSIGERPLGVVKHGRAPASSSAESSER